MQRYIGIAVDSEGADFCIDTLSADNEREANRLFKLMRDGYSGHAIYTLEDWQRIADDAWCEPEERIRAFMGEMMVATCSECNSPSDGLESTYCGTLCPSCLAAHCRECQVCARDFVAN